MRVVLLFIFVFFVSTALKAQHASKDGSERMLYVRNVLDKLQELIEKDNYSENKYGVQFRLADSVEYVIPMYRMEYVGRVDSLAMMIDMTDDPRNYVAIMKCGDSYYSHYSMKGIADYRLDCLMNNEGAYKPLLDTASVRGYAYLDSAYFGAFTHNEIKTIMQNYSGRHIFCLSQSFSLWVMNEKKLMRITVQNNSGRHVVCEDGQKYYETLVAKIKNRVGEDYYEYMVSVCDGYYYFEDFEQDRYGYKF